MKEYDVYLPLHYNDGRPIQADLLTRVKGALVQEFGGLTLFPQENEGLWKVGGKTFRDRIIIIRVLAAEEDGARGFFRSLREWLRAELAQEDVLIVEREVRAVDEES